MHKGLKFYDKIKWENLFILSFKKVVFNKLILWGIIILTL